MNEELHHPGLDLIVPDITKACPMFFPWSAESARRATKRPAPDAPYSGANPSREPSFWPALGE